MKKCLKRTENTKITNILKITIISHVVPQIDWVKAFCQFWTIFVPLPIFGPKNQYFRKMRKNPPRYIIILHTLKCIMKVGVKINVGIRDFS